jgi:hypothetical protein
MLPPAVLRPIGPCINISPFGAYSSLIVRGQETELSANIVPLAHRSGARKNSPTPEFPSQIPIPRPRKPKTMGKDKKAKAAEKKARVAQKQSKKVDKKEKKGKSKGKGEDSDAEDVDLDAVLAEYARHVGGCRLTPSLPTADGEIVLALAPMQLAHRSSENRDSKRSTSK